MYVCVWVCVHGHRACVGVMVEWRKQFKMLALYYNTS